MASEVAHLSYQVHVELSRCFFYNPSHGLVMQIGRREERPRQGQHRLAVLLARCLGHLKYNKAHGSQTLLMLLEAENTQGAGLPPGWLL